MAAPRTPFLLRRRFAIGYGALLLALFGASALDREGLRRWLELDREVKRVQQENRDLERDNARMRREVQALTGDPAALERAAREDLGYVRPGEIILKLDEGAAR
ncbi:MAG TPA: septum formation initiator family protein [Anaeromyxobacteraceae bacterium]|nr:septum formation initiator family protein [Anaeromyxobacteraceae bacterium]